MDNPVPEESHHQPVSDIRIYFWIVYKRLPVVVLLVILGLLGSWMNLQTKTTSYEARALVRLEEVTVPLANDAGGNNRQSSTGTMKLPLGTAARLVRTEVCARRAVADIKDRFPSGAISESEIIESTTVETTEPDLLQVICRSENPQRALLIANGLAKAFVDVRTQQARAEASQTRKFLDQQLTKSDRALADIQDQIGKYKKSTGIFDVDAQVKNIFDTMAIYQEEINKARVARTEARTRVNHLAASFKGANRIDRIDVAQDNPLVEALKKQLVEKQVELVQLQSRYTDDHPEVQRAKYELEAVQRKLNSRLEQTVTVKQSIPNPFYDDLRKQYLEAKSNLVETEAREGAFTAVLQKKHPGLTALLDKKEKWDQLQDVAITTREAHKAIWARLQDAKVMEAAKLGDAMLADVANVPKQLGVNRSRIWAFGIIMGFMAGAGLALLLDFLDDTIRNPEEIQQVTGVKELALVPLIPEDSNRDDFVRLMRSKSRAAEAIRTLRSNLKFVSARNQGKTWMITSCYPHEGKTFIGTTLAISLAHTGKRVILVDADLRHPGAHKNFGMDPLVGLINVLVGDLDLEQALKPTGVEGLELLATGPVPPNPAELLDSEAMRSLLDRLKGMADVVIVDSPPVNMVTDPAVLAPYVDGVLLVLETSRVKRPTLKRVRETLERANGRIIGTVINKITAKSSYYYYAYGDYSYGQYYSHYYSEDRAATDEDSVSS